MCGWVSASRWFLIPCYTISVFVHAYCAQFSYIFPSKNRCCAGLSVVVLCILYLFSIVKFPHFAYTERKVWRRLFSCFLEFLLCFSFSSRCQCLSCMLIAQQHGERSWKREIIAFSCCAFEEHVAHRYGATRECACVCVYVLAMQEYEEKRLCLKYGNCPFRIVEWQNAIFGGCVEWKISHSPVLTGAEDAIRIKIRKSGFLFKFSDVGCVFGCCAFVCKSTMAQLVIVMCR